MGSMTIGKKLMLSIGGTVVLTLVAAIVSVVSLSGMGDDMQALIKNNARRLFLAGDINAITSDMQAEERGMMAKSLMNDKAGSDRYNQDFNESAATLKKRFDEYLGLSPRDEDRRMLTGLQTSLEALLASHAEYQRDLSDPARVDAAKQLYQAKLSAAVDEISRAGAELSAKESREMAALAESSQATASRTIWTAIVLALLAAGVGGGATLVIRQINSSLRQAVEELSEGAKQTASAAGQVSSSSQSLAQGASEQAASLEETSASSEQISSMAQKNSDNSRSAAQFVSESQDKIVATNQSLEQMVAAMTEINESSDKISKIIKTIDEIAFQTNILALNAAVEAARAGEAGMGFAVVADEVRSLAQRCAQAAKDTAGLIEDSIAKSNDGKTKVDQVAVAFREITTLSERVKTLADEVNIGSEEQARGIQQIGQAIVQMEQVTQRTAAGAEESASAAEELNAQSETMLDVVQRLSVMVDGGGPRATREESSLSSIRSTPARIPSVVPKAPVAAKPASWKPEAKQTPSLKALTEAVGTRTAMPAADHAPVKSPSFDKNTVPTDDDFLEF